MHHSDQMGVFLSAKFDKDLYDSLSKSEKIKYAKANVPREKIISFQNACALAMNPTFGTQTIAVRGFAGRGKESVGIVIQTIPNSPNRYLSVIASNGKHISSYPVTPKKLAKIVKDHFWIWKDRNYK